MAEQGKKFGIEEQQQPQQHWTGRNGDAVLDLTIFPTEDLDVMIEFALLEFEILTGTWKYQYPKTWLVGKKEE